MLIPGFGVVTAILDHVDIVRRWCKLNFGLLRDHANPRNFTVILLKEKRYFLLFIIS